MLEALHRRGLAGQGKKLTNRMADELFDEYREELKVKYRDAESFRKMLNRLVLAHITIKSMADYDFFSAISLEPLTKLAVLKENALSAKQELELPVAEFAKNHTRVLKGMGKGVLTIWGLAGVEGSLCFWWGSRVSLDRTTTRQFDAPVWPPS